jgi:hypothetical protein
METTLTPEQIHWFNQRHDFIQLAYQWASRGDKTSLNAFGDYTRTSSLWRSLFGDMSWDEAYRRYQRTPNIRH